MENVKIIAEQIEKLLQRLDDHRKSFFEPAPEQRPQRIYFIDSDVIYDYINGCIKNPFNDWASLLSLDSSVKGGSRKELSKELDDLTQVIGQAVTRFLFGQFNLQLGAQQKRYYLAAEHEREMRSMIVSILHQAFDGGFERWSELESCYIGLCKKNFSPAQALHAVESIFNTIIDRSEFGMIPRAYAVDRNFTSSLSTNLIRPTVVDASSFIFSEEDRDYDEGFKQLKSAFFEDFLKWLKEQSSGAEKYFPLKRKVFDMHGPRVPFYYYINALSSEPHLFSHVIDFESDLRLQAAMAINEVNDVASLARLTSLAKYLNEKHALPENKHWEVCLISGSLKLQGLLSSLKNTEFRGLLEDRVRLIHPLCFLRHPELYDPDGVKALGEDEHQDEEYALTWIFDQKERDYTKINDEKKVREFIDSLTRTLQGVVVREVRRHDYALRDFHRKIDFNDGYDSHVMMSNIRNYIAHKFTDTFLKLTEMSFDNRHRLSCVSLPVWI